MRQQSKTIQLLIISILSLMGIVTLVACSNKTSFRLEQDSQTYFYSDVAGMELTLPAVLNGSTSINADNLLWSVESGTSAYLLENGRFMLESGESGAGKSGATVFKVKVKDGKNITTLKYTVNVIEGLSGVFNWSIFDSARTPMADYSTNPGIAKRRVFGNKQIVDGKVEKSSEIIRLQPGVEGISNDDYQITINGTSGNNDICSYEFVGDNRLQLTFQETGSANLRISLDNDELGDDNFVFYTFTVVDGINVSTMSELQAVQSLVKYNTESNQYSYSGKTPDYTGWDGKNFENIVLRNNITNIDDITLFYGSVYGNGYTLDATPYGGDTTKNNHPNHKDASKYAEDSCFYLMSDNTVLDNVNLVGYGKEVGNLESLKDTKNVLGVYGVIDSLDTTRVDDHIEIARQPQNIRIINSIVERGKRGIYISGASNQDKPVTIESCVVYYTGDHGVWLSTDWFRPNETQDIQKEYRNFVTIKDIIITENKFPPIGIQNNVDTGLLGPTNSGYGSLLTITGQQNYIYNWIQYSQMDFGKAEIIPGNPASAVEIADLVKAQMQTEAGKQIADKIVHYYGNDSNEENNMWFNLGVYGNFNNTSARPNYRIQPNTVDWQQSNFQDNLLEEQFLTVMLVLEVSLYFFDKNIPENAPNPRDNLSVVVPQRIAAITPAPNN